MQWRCDCWGWQRWLLQRQKKTKTKQKNKDLNWKGNKNFDVKKLAWEISIYKPPSPPSIFIITLARKSVLIFHICQRPPDDIPFATMEAGNGFTASSSLRATTPTRSLSRAPSTASTMTHSRVISTLPTKDALRDSPEENTDPGKKHASKNQEDFFHYLFGQLPLLHVPSLVRNKTDPLCHCFTMRRAVSCDCSLCRGTLTFLRRKSFCVLDNSSTLCLEQILDYYLFTFWLIHSLQSIHFHSNSNSLQNSLLFLHLFSRVSLPLRSCTQYRPVANQSNLCILYLSFNELIVFHENLL